MILADKLIRLRKRAGWSQEDLAERVGVSRQSVSKWEGAQSLPETEKILELANLFGVTIDYLLRDEIEDEPNAMCHADRSNAVRDTDETTTRRVVTDAECQRYLALRLQTAPRKAFATALCVLSPVVLIFLAELSDVGVLSEGAAAGIGLACLFGFVTVAVALFYLGSERMKAFAYLDSTYLSLSADITAAIEREKEFFSRTYATMNLIGVVLCILSPVPIIVVGCLECEDLICVLAVCVLFCMVAIACFLFVWAGTVQGSYERLLEEGDFRRSIKVRSLRGSIKGAVSVIYWSILTAVFLLVTCLPLAWAWRAYSWLIFAVGGVLYVAILLAVDLIENQKSEESKS